MKFRALALGKSHLPAAVWTVTAILSLWGMASVARADGEPAADLASRVSRLAAEVEAAEDIRAIKHLQRAYGFYLDKGMWEDLSQLFTADAVANYPTGIYVGKDSIRRHLFLNVGAVKLGEVGLGDGRLYIHMNIQPVVHLDPGAQTAKGRWRALAMFGSYGGSATWAEGVYELSYRKEGGVWKIHTLDYYCGFGAPYQTGWVPPETPRTGSGGGRRPLAYPPDRERKMECDGFPAACIAPFHYGNPGRTAAAHAWTISDAQLSAQLDINRHANLRTVLADLSRRATRLEDEQTIENLQRIYGYYFDRAAWDQVADLFATNATVEIGLQGVYVGKQHLRRFLETLAPQGLSAGVLNDHIQLQTLVDIAPDGRTAYCRSRELAMSGVYGRSGVWSEGVYENTYVKDHGTWKFKSLHFYPTLSTDYDLGWARSALPPVGPSTTFPPDRPPSETYNIYPKAFVPPYHYRNPVTGEAPRYPGVDRGGPDSRHAAAVLIPTRKLSAAALVKDPERALAETERTLDRVESYEELENLESAYGYYLDKNLWNELADLFAKEGSMELAQRGVYKGQDHVRAFLLTVFGRGKEGPVAGRLGNHLQLQPVIDVAADGRTAKIRSRMLQQMSLGGRASLGGAVYENEAVKEGGVWRFKTDHAYNTFSAGYIGGWARNASRAMPGPSKDLPPDAPPTAVITMFPVVYDIPFHYANPVTGRTEVPPVRPAEDPEVVAAMAASAQAGVASGEKSPSGEGIPSGDGVSSREALSSRARVSSGGEGGMPTAIAAALREIGPKIDGPRTAALYTPLLASEPYAGVDVVRDVHYGPHERHVADVFTSSTNVQGAIVRPIVVFIHGGGFTRGAKHSPGSPFYDNIGVWAVRHGLVGVTINYRLAPEFQWPAGVEDLTLLTRWVRAHAGEYGGDPAKVFLWGHSAGAAHVADYLARAANTGADPGVAGAILTSGFYDLGDKVSIWKDYYGDDVAQYPARSSLPGLLKTATPLLVTYAELDPDSFQAETRGLIEARSREGRPVHSVRLAGHSHISETYAVGTGDESLSGPVLDFIQGAGGAAKGGSR